MKKTLLPIAFAAACLLAVSCSKDDDDQEPTAETYTIDFSDLTLAKDSFWNGSNGGGKFSSGRGVFLNSYEAEYGSWGGFAYSNRNDTSASGFTAQFDVYTSTPSGKGIFAVGYMDTYTPAIPTITFAEPVALKSAEFALNAYAYKIIRDGDEVVPAKKFTAEDWYKITVKSVDSSNVASDSLEVYLADFRDGKSVLIDRWTEFSLAPLKGNKLTFEASSTDNGEWGMNTPAYFCIDNIALSKE
ncbi:MAG: DUF4465 domain-containing protein [Prevotellaceae bacterium]|nr:DUF4465 domain-containing protein [Prevotellaceae bacterium]